MLGTFLEFKKALKGSIISLCISIVLLLFALCILIFVDKKGFEKVEEIKEENDKLED